MQFSELLPGRRSGLMIRRRSWESRNVFCQMLPGRLALYINNAEILSNWSPTVSDVLSDDWEFSTDSQLWYHTSTELYSLIIYAEEVGPSPSSPLTLETSTDSLLG